MLYMWIQAVLTVGYSEYFHIPPRLPFRTKAFMAAAAGILGYWGHATEGMGVILGLKYDSSPGASTFRDTILF